MLLIAALQFGLVALIVVYLTLNMLELVRLPRVSGPLEEHPSISICVPARNEERSIEACLESLCGQDYPDLEVIVVDDQSTDSTPEIIQRVAGRHSRLRPLSGTPLPEGWYGKPHALHQAVQRASGDILVFTDADVVFSPWALRAALYLMQVRRLDMLTLMPGSVFGSFWEKTVQPVIFSFIAAKTRFARIHDSSQPDAMGFGAFIMIRRDLYEHIGGHAALRQAILDDIGLARLAKARGARLLAADARDAMSIRMYHSLQEIWQGWRKNVFLALDRSIFWTLMHAAILPAFLFTPYLVLALALAGGEGWITTLLAAGAVLLSLASCFALCDQLQLSRWNALGFPLGSWVAAAVMINSMVHILGTGGSVWRGRVYPKPVH